MVSLSVVLSGETALHEKRAHSAPDSLRECFPPDSRCVRCTEKVLRANLPFCYTGHEKDVYSRLRFHKINDLTASSRDVLKQD